MNRPILAAAAAGAIALSGCMPFGGMLGNDQGDEITAAEFVALGASPLDEERFRAELVGRELIDTTGTWIWTIAEDGTAPSNALDGSWAAPSVWEFRDGQYCRGETEPSGCGTIYELDGVYRISTADGTLAGWAVTPRAAGEG